jgi:hypothetical protein
MEADVLTITCLVIHLDRPSAKMKLVGGTRSKNEIAEKNKIQKNKIETKNIFFFFVSLNP